MAQRQFNAPGVYRTETDISDILVATGVSNGGIVIRSKRGPVNRPVLVTNDKEYVETFGDPIFTSGSGTTNENEKLIPEYGYGGYASLEFLKESQNLYVVRDFEPGSDNYSGVEFDSNLSITNLSSGISGARYVKGDRLDTVDYIKIIETYGQTGGGSDAFTVAYVGPGTDGNNLAVTIEPFSLSADWKFSYDEYPTSAEVASATSLDNTTIETWYPTGSQVFKMNVYVKQNTQTWDDLFRNNTERTSGTLYVTPVETFYGSLKEDLTDGDNNNLFIETVVNGNSQYIYVKKGLSFNYDNFGYVNSAGENNLLPDAEDTNGNYYVKYKPVTTSADTITFGILSGGASYQDNGLNETTGWEIFEERENAPVNILIGTSYETAQKQEVGRIAATRADCIASLQSGQLSHDTTTNVIDSEQYGYSNPSYVALYAGYSKIYDKYNDKNVWLPNSIFGAALMARTDRIANPWDAPAGTNRGIMSVQDQRKIWSFNEIGKLQDRNINVPKFVAGTGNVMWGQLTAQMKKSALRDINVRRLLLYIENNVEVALQQFMFENNTQKTRLRAFVLIDEFLSGILASDGITSYSVVVDETNNTPAVIDANQMNVDIYVAPSRAIYVINLNTIITRTGISLEEVRIATA